MTDDDDFEARVAELKLAVKRLTQEMQARAGRRERLREVAGPGKLEEFDATQEIRDAITELQAAVSKG
jgi:hypothetical protein